MCDRRWYSGHDVPLFISVSGHVDLTDDSVEAAVKELSELLSDLKEKFEHTRLVLMSALAEGADIIASEVALGKGINVAPVIPCNVDTYLPDESDESKKDYVQRFNDIIGNELTYTPLILQTSSDEPRDSYRNLSAFLVLNSHMMVVMWDGRMYDRNGGTFDTMRMACEGVGFEETERYSKTVCGTAGNISMKRLDSTEDCLPYWIRVERESKEPELRERGCSDPGTRADGEGGYIMPSMFNLRDDYDTCEFWRNPGAEPGMPEMFKEMFGKIDSLNVDLRKIDPKGSGSKWETRSYLLDHSEDDIETARCVDKVKRDGIMDPMAERYHAVDEIALRNQRSSFKNIHILILVSVITGLAFSLFILSGGSLIVNLVYTVSMISGMVLAKYHSKKSEYSRFIEFRAIAESMRVEYYRALLGSKGPMPDMCYGYMKNQLFWIRSVLKSWRSHFLNDYDQASLLEDDEALRIADVCWVKGQRDYHRKVGERNGARLGRLGRRTQILVGATTVLSALLIPMMIAIPDALGADIINLDPLVVGGFTLSRPMEVSVSTVIRLVMILLVAATSYFTLSSSLVHGGTRAESDAKVLMFDLARARMRQAKDHKTRLEILWELGDQCIKETNDWVFEHRSKDFKKGTLNVSPMDDS